MVTTFDQKYALIVCVALKNQLQKLYIAREPFCGVQRGAYGSLH